MITGNIEDKLCKLVKEFKLANYKSLNESQTRLSYIDKFWSILGWHVSDIEQVKVEVTDKLFKRPDYTFFNGKKILFFVEAKKPSEDLKRPKHIYQTKLYCWNAGVPLAILTDFEEFRPFRSYGKPNLSDANKGIIKQFDMTFESYPERAFDLLNTFGREAVIGGSLNALLKPKQMELRDTVDKDFLNTLSKWRKDLSEQIIRFNKFDNEFELAEAVQRILDRLVFLRILHDREIENYDFIREISKNNISGTYSAFVKVCRELAPKYNGLIFNPHPLSENLKIESGLFKKIVKELDIEESPYRFDVISVEVLGTIYERFLGDEIGFDNKGKVEINQKPEVRKAGGVYYTPQYIVEYIVNNTVGKLLEQCKTPEDAAKLKILDPACGSGSFLLGAFDLLIKWHEDYFSANIPKMLEKSGKNLLKLAYFDKSNKIRLTARMKSRILQNNIYGVDLDKQATEVAQMSLYIKVLEGMANEGEYVMISHETILPKMENNIKCGNSLIGSDFINDDFFGLSKREKQKINPFDWEVEFPDIFRGTKENFNKEYFENELKKGLENAKTAIDYAQNAYKHTTKAYEYAQKFDLISEPAVDYGIKRGFDAVIGNPPWVQPVMLDKNSQKYLSIHFEANTDLYSMFIEKQFQLLKDNHILGFIVPSLFIKGVRYENLRNVINKSCNEILIKEYGDGVFTGVKMPTSIILLTKGFGRTSHNFFVNKNKLIFSRVQTLPLNQISFIRRGLEIGRDKILKNGKIKCLNGGCIDSYNIKEYLYISESTLNEFNKDKGIFLSPKLIVRETGNTFFATIENNDVITNRSLYNVRITNSNYSTFCILGIMNSTLLKYYFKEFIAPETNIFPKIRIVQLNEIPIPINATIDNSHKLVTLVERMLKLHNDKPAADESDRRHIEQYIAATDKEIDRIVYQLYDLTPEEIKIVEGK
ncbi:MAG: TaqI-like C-terminal specificity domain-containing protein [Candidatus Kapabacteria bacterium]|nr:TaqI-like C-terminal specificity domain-containing protein [Candidatus Kapabacteria bacterium]